MASDGIIDPWIGTNHAKEKIASKYGISEHTPYRLKAKFGDMQVTDVEG